MDTDGSLEKVVFYGFVASFIFLMYLLLGNGLSDLAFVEISHPYHAIINVPAWAAFSAFFTMYFLMMVAVEDQTLKEAGSLLALVGTFGSLAILAVDTIISPAPMKFLAVAFLIIMSASEVLLFIPVWRKHH